MATDLILNNNLEKFMLSKGPFDWKMELCLLIKKAYDENKLLQSHHQQLIFTPKGLAAEIIKGRFIWGVVNWGLIDRGDFKIDFPDPPEMRLKSGH